MEELLAKDEQHLVPLEIDDCRVPIGCPWGADCPEDAFPDKWGILPDEPVDQG